MTDIQFYMILTGLNAILATVSDNVVVKTISASGAIMGIVLVFAMLIKGVI